jgi:hypothetical protein
LPTGKVWATSRDRHDFQQDAEPRGLVLQTK